MMSQTKPDAAKAAPAEEEGPQPKRARLLSEPGLPVKGAAVRLVAGTSEDKGARATMEDVAVVQLDARPESSNHAPLDVRVSFAAVFDGHGGAEIAELAGQLLHASVLTAGLQQVIEAAQGGGKVDVKAAKAAITAGFAKADAAVLLQCKENGWAGGACAVAVWVLGDTVLVANVGDCKAVLARVTDKDVGSVKAGCTRGLVLSKDHLALQERQRIEKAGGWVSADGRLNGRMQVSRSFGDATLKQVGCICTPDVTAFPLTPRDQFLLLACDGFWTVFDSQGAVDLAGSLIKEGREPKAVTNRLVNEAVRQRKCTDNCTVMLLMFDSG